MTDDESYSDNLTELKGFLCKWVNIKKLRNKNKF